jgi:hypothetical protein
VKEYLDQLSKEADDVPAANIANDNENNLSGGPVCKESSFKTRM